MSKKRFDDHYKIRSKYKSISDKLIHEGKVSPEFLVMLGTLTFEELIGLRVESAAAACNGKLLGFPMASGISMLVYEALTMYAFLHTPSLAEAATFLGVGIDNYRKMIRMFGIPDKAHRKLDSEDERVDDW